MRTRGVLTIISFLLAGCSSGVLDIKSSDYDTVQERIHILKKYTVMYSEIDDAIYSIYNVNGRPAFTIPGPSHWDYRIAMKCRRSDLDRWVKGLEEGSKDAIRLDWGYDLVRGNSSWKTVSSPKVYIRKGENTVVAVFRDEGIIFKRMCTRPIRDW